MLKIEKPEWKGSISACMIVKDEEAVLEECLSSISNWVDEIIIVDTGSTDKTVSIAEKYGAKIYHQKWANDFSLHRNYSISKATKEWVFIIDADERVVKGHGENIKKMLPEIKQDVIVVDMHNLYRVNGKYQPRGHFRSYRFFRLSYGPSYEQRVHNHPVIKDKTTVLVLPFTMHHIGYDLPPEGMAKKKERLVRMCREWAEREPENPEALFHLTRALRYNHGKPNHEGFPEIVKILEKIIGMGQVNGDINNIYIQSLSMIAWIKYTMAAKLQKESKGTVNWEEIVSYAKKAIALKPDYLDPTLLLGFVYSLGQDIKEAERWFYRYLRLQEAYADTVVVDQIDTAFTHERITALKGLIDIEEWKERQFVS